MAIGRATREALLSEAGFEKFSGPRIGSVGGSCFVDDFISCWSLNPVGGIFWLFRFVWWLDCLLLKESAAWGDCLKCFLLLRSLWVFAKVAGFHLNDCIEYFTALVGPLAPLDSYRSFQPRKNMNYWSFQSIPLLINSINLKRDGVSGKMWEGEILKAFLLRHRFDIVLHWVIELKHSTE